MEEMEREEEEEEVVRSLLPTNPRFHNTNTTATATTTAPTFWKHRETQRVAVVDWRPYWLGLGLFLALFSFWLLDTLKDPIFGQLVSGDLNVHQPRAKLASVLCTLLLVCSMELLSSSSSSSSNGIRKENKELSTHEILDGGGTWQRMETTVHTSTRTTPNNNNNDPHDPVSSRVFLYIGLPYAVFFAVMASILQYNPRVALHDPSAWLLAQEENDTTTSSSFSYAHTARPQTTTTTTTYWHVIGYGLFAAIESFGSLAVASFWSFTNSTLSLVDAERCYGTIIALAQLGAILGSTMVTMHIWNSITLIVLASLIILLHIIVMRVYSRRFPPATDPLEQEQQLAGTVVRHHGQRRRRRRRSKRMAPMEATTAVVGTSTSAASLWSGVYLILKYNYVLLILGASCLYEVSLTCLNFQMTLLGWNRFEETDDGSSNQRQQLSFKQFMGHYGQMVNVSSLVFSSILFPFLIKRVGVRLTIRLFPTLLLAANVIAFVAMPGNLTVLFFSLSLLKAMTYSIHDPAKEILYIPTSNAIKFQSKFWIDVVGARIAKAIGSTINRYAGSVNRSIRVASAPSLLTVSALWWVCYTVGSQFDQLVESGTTVGADEEEVGNDDRRTYTHNKTAAEYRDLYDEDIEDFDCGRGALYSDDDGSIEMQQTR